MNPVSLTPSWTFATEEGSRGIADRNGRALNPTDENGRDGIDPRLLR